MKSNVHSNTYEEIEVLDVPDRAYARVRVRERGSSWSSKASIYLGPDQLEEHARACLDMAGRVRDRTRGCT